MVAKILLNPRMTGQETLQQLADLTGGQAFFIKDLRNMDEICDRISENLRNESVIGYAPTDLIKDGKWRKVHLKVNEISHASVHARSGLLKKAKWRRRHFGAACHWRVRDSKYARKTCLRLTVPRLSVLGLYSLPGVASRDPLSRNVLRLSRVG